MGHSFKLVDLIDYEVQLQRWRQGSADEQLFQLDAELIKQGKVASLRAWVEKVRGDNSGFYTELRILAFTLAAFIGVLLGWATIQVLLHYDGKHPVNIFPFLLCFVGVPILFFMVLVFQGAIARIFSQMPFGLARSSWHWLISKLSTKYSVNGSIAVIWDRFNTIYHRLCMLQAWLLSQCFGLAYYLSALLSFLMSVTVNDYAFAWRTTLQLSPETLISIVNALALPFSWLGSWSTPTFEVIQATQFDRFTHQYLLANAPHLAGSWWPFLACLMAFYGCLPRVILLLFFCYRLKVQLKNLDFNDSASEKLWVHLQQGHTMRWQATAGTVATLQESVPTVPSMHVDKIFVIVRWRQAPFTDETLRLYFKNRGINTTVIIDAEGRSSEIEIILNSLKSDNLALALVCEPWELPGESFNRLRLAIREKKAPAIPILLVPMGHPPHDNVDGALWEASIQAFRDPYVGLVY